MSETQQTAGDGQDGAAGAGQTVAGQGGAVGVGQTAAGPGGAVGPGQSIADAADQALYFEMAQLTAILAKQRAAVESMSRAFENQCRLLDRYRKACWFRTTDETFLAIETDVLDWAARERAGENGPAAPPTSERTAGG